ncbi:MAG: hypothetical protein IJL87_05765, partial [Clostridia bacterium]|nr:hypothetical protein [Clostridia bacterium]
MNDNKDFKNPYLEGAQPGDSRMDYRQIMEEYRARRRIETGMPADMGPGEDPDRMILPELAENRQPRTNNRFAFDLKKEVAAGVDLNDIRSIHRVSYGDTYRPRKSRANIRRNYAGLANLDNVDSEEVRATINSARRRAQERKKSPVSAPEETVEQKRARIEAMLPTPDQQRELDRIMEQRGKIYATPSFMRDELQFGDEPTVNETDIITPLRTNINLPGFSFRQRYMNRGLEDANIPEIPVGPVAPEGFGGDGGDLPLFESEASNWSLRPDDERFTHIETKDKYEVIPMGGMVIDDKRHMFRAKVRLGGKNTASAFEAGAGSIKSAHSERLAGELASKRKKSRLRIASAIPDALKSAPLPSQFTDISQMDNQAQQAAHLAGLEAGRALAQAQNAPVQHTAPNREEVWHDDVPEFVPKRVQNESLAPTHNTFTDGNFEKPRQKGIINRQKSTYTYLFD